MMQSDQSSTPLASVLSWIIFVILFCVLMYTLYLLYLTIPGEPENLSVSIEKPTYNEDMITAEVKQFYPQMKFNDNDISYNLDKNCLPKDVQRMNRAFNEISMKVSKINFYQTVSAPDIQIICTKPLKEDINKDYFIAGEGGAKEIIPTGRYNVITNGIIYLYEKDKKSINCDYPNIEIHELLHVFGFNHSTNKKSIMYPFLESCDQIIDSSIIDKLESLYREENLPDLYFENLTVIKKGRYLNFNTTIKNSGLIDSGNTSLTVTDNKGIVETYYLGNISFGGGIFIQTTNLQLNSRNPESITFVINEENKIKEIDKKNNIAIINI